MATKTNKQLLEEIWVATVLKPKKKVVLPGENYPHEPAEVKPFDGNWVRPEGVKGPYPKGMNPETGKPYQTEEETKEQYKRWGLKC